MRTRYKIVAGILALGAGLTCFATYMAMLLTRANSREPIVPDLLALNAAFWMGWAFLSLPIIALSERVRVDRRTWKRLWMEVEDDGCGPSETGLESLRQGIGLTNTRARLAHHYGAHHRFEFHKRVAGFAVVIAIPLKTMTAPPAASAAPAAGSETRVA